MKNNINLLQHEINRSVSALLMTVMSDIFRFRQFEIDQEMCAMKVGTDSVLLGAWSYGGRQVLDIGCGTGIISLMIAQRYPDADITAIDIVDDCCRQTRINADKTEWGGRIHTVCKSLQDYVVEMAGKVKFDAIVSNPPFFVDSMKNPDSFRTLARHTDSLPFNSLANGVNRLLTDDGTFSVILAEECFKQFVDEAWFSGLYLAEDIAFKAKVGKPVKRHLMKFVKDRTVVLSCSTHILQNEDGTKSEWYKKLVDDFYL